MKKVFLLSNTINKNYTSNRLYFDYKKAVEAFNEQADNFKQTYNQEVVFDELAKDTRAAVGGLWGYYDRKAYSLGDNVSKVHFELRLVEVTEEEYT